MTARANTGFYLRGAWKSRPKNLEKRKLLGEFRCRKRNKKIPGRGWKTIFPPKITFFWGRGGAFEPAMCVSPYVIVKVYWLKIQFNSNQWLGSACIVYRSKTKNLKRIKSGKDREKIKFSQICICCKYHNWLYNYASQFLIE